MAMMSSRSISGIVARPFAGGTRRALPVPGRQPAGSGAAPSSSRGAGGGTGEEGFALVLVLVVVGLLVTLVVQFNYASRVELELARSYVESIQAAYLAEAGVHVAMALLRTDDNESADGHVIDTLDDQWAQAIPYIPVDDASSVYLSIEDTSRYLNVNQLVTDSGDAVNERLAGVFEELLRQLGRDDAAALVDSVIDWIDPDDQITADGAEDAYYRGVDPPVEIANRRLLSVEELRVVKGFRDDPQLLQGTEEVPGLLKLITAYGTKAFNINTMDAADGYPWLLTSLGGADIQDHQAVIDETTADEIRAARLDEPFATDTDIKNRALTESYRAIQYGGPGVRLLEVTSSYFTIRAVGFVGKLQPGGDDELTQKSVTAVVKRDTGGKVKILYWREE
jgi:type II secretory pathway component PulK